MPATLAVVLGLATALLSGGVAHADGESPTAVVVRPAEPTSAKGRIALSARLTTADGKPTSNQPVTFFAHVTLFGDREALLGTATTDSTGVAALSYQPAQAGTQTITARFDGAPNLAASSGSADIQVAQASPAIHSEPLPFAGIREWLPSMLVAIVIGVWVVLLGVFLGTVRGIRSATQS